MRFIIIFSDLNIGCLAHILIEKEIGYDMSVGIWKVLRNPIPILVSVSKTLPECSGAVTGLLASR